ncbi:MAG: chemotaxis protein CheW [Candidatus Ozemobacteraceae bacterium]
MTDPKGCMETIGIRGDGSCPKLPQVIHCRNCEEFTILGRNLLHRPAPPGYLEEWSHLLASVKDTNNRGRCSIMAFRIASEYLGLSARHFVEIIDQRVVRPIPHRTNGPLLGLISVRGEIHPCVSMSMLLGISDNRPQLKDREMVLADQKEGSTGSSSKAGITRCCVVRKDGPAWVFPVDDVLGLYHFSDEDVMVAPTTTRHATPRFSTGILLRDGHSIGILDPDRIFSALSGATS